jgi:uncharacterized protein (TIGR03083 family)
MNQMWSTIAAERGALADDLAGLSDGQWTTGSLCEEWTVREVLAHMTSTARMTPPKFVAGFAGSRFDFPAFSRKGIQANLGTSPTETLQLFRAEQSSTKAPPGPKTSWLGETIVHAEDIRRPLGLRHVYPGDAVRQVIDFYKNSNTLIGTKNRIGGLTLRATDTDWTHGSGPLVEGPLLTLLMAATGRTAHLDDLTGPGVDTLRSR